jgi:hypothetical protein
VFIAGFAMASAALTAASCPQKGSCRIKICPCKELGWSTFHFKVVIFDPSTANFRHFRGKKRGLDWLRHPARHPKYQAIWGNIGYLGGCFD